MENTFYFPSSIERYYDIYRINFSLRYPTVAFYSLINIFNGDWTTRKANLKIRIKPESHFESYQMRKVYGVTFLKGNLFFPLVDRLFILFVVSRWYEKGNFSLYFLRQIEIPPSIVVRALLTFLKKKKKEKFNTL